MDRQGWSVDTDTAGQRLDRHVASYLDVPRNRVQHWIQEGLVTVNGDPEKASHSLRAGDRIECRIPPPPAGTLQPEPGELDILYEDEDLLILNKPPGLVVHPGAGRRTGTLVHRLLAYKPGIEGVGSAGRPGIVHRLDKDTSGALIVALTDGAYRRLSRDFARRRIDKRYLAVVYGELEVDERIVDAAVGRHPSRRKEMTVRPDGRPARSRLRRLSAAAGISLLEVVLESGRTHQIRVHLKHIHHPLVGDPIYGEARWKNLPAAVQRPLRSFSRPALHAWRLVLKHPVTGESLAVDAAPPADLRGLWEEVTSTPFPDLEPLQINSSSAT
jgi:23S rRNA pseudouridine1911/1915/1917 synthase